MELCSSTLVRHRRPAGGYDRLTMYLHVRPIDYRDTSSNRCGWPKYAAGTRQHLNERDLWPACTWGGSKTCYPTSSWNSCVTDVDGDITSTSGPDGLIVEIQVSNGSCCNPVDIDLARIQVRWPPD